MSPTVFITQNTRIVIYPKDHAPPHVHVIGPDAEAKIEIGSWNIISSNGFSHRALKGIVEFLKLGELTLKEVWNDYCK